MTLSPPGGIKIRDTYRIYFGTLPHPFPFHQRTRRVRGRNQTKTLDPTLEYSEFSWRRAGGFLRDSRRRSRPSYLPTDPKQLKSGG